MKKGKKKEVEVEYKVKIIKNPNITEYLERKDREVMDEIYEKWKYVGQMIEFIDGKRDKFEEIK